MGYNPPNSKLRANKPESRASRRTPIEPLEAEENLETPAPAVKTAVVDEDTQIRRSRRPGGILVEVVGGPMDGMSRRASETSLSIGRSEESDLPLILDTSVSAQHARVLIEDGQYWLEDLGSTNGTYLGEGRIRGRVPVGPGTVFVVGRTTLELTAS